jgi:gamma-aminobutyric acid type B receptor
MLHVKHAQWLAIVMVIMFNLNTCLAENKTYVFGINLALDPVLSGWNYEENLGTLQGLEIWRDWWNGLPASQRTTAWGDTFTVELHVETFSDYSTNGPTQMAGVYGAYANMTQNSSIDYYFGTAGFQGIPVRTYCLETLNIPIQVFPLDSSEAFYALPGSFSSVPANKLRMVSILSYLRLNQGSSIAVIQINDYGYQNEMCGGIVEKAAANGIDVLAYYDDMPFTWADFGQVDGIGNRTAIWTDAMDNIMNLNPDAIAICDYTAGAAWALQYMKNKDYVPKMMVISPIFSWPSNIDMSLSDYVVSITPYSSAARYTPQVGFTDSAGFNTLVQQRYGVPAGLYQAVATLAGMMWTNALTSAPTNSSADLIQAMRLAQFQSFMGTVAMDVHDWQTIPTLIEQLMNSSNDAYVVGPPLAAAAQLTYPMPTWSERVFAPKFGSGVEIAGTVLMGIGTLISIGWIVFLIIHWRQPVIYAASPLFCVLILVGSLVVYGSVFTWMPNLVNSATCYARPFVLPIGFMLMFGALIAKTYRIHVLLNTRSMDIIVVSNLQVGLIVLAIVLGQVVLSVFAVSLTSLESTVHVVDPYRISSNYMVCTFSKSLKAVFGVNVAIAGLLLAWGSYLCWKIKDIPMSKYDESKSIAFSVYNVAFFAALVIAIQLAVGNSNRDLTFMLTAICCFAGALITTCVLFTTKVLAIYKPSALKDSSSSSTSTTHLSTQSSPSSSRKQSHTSSPSGLDSDASMIQMLKKDNAVLRAANAKLRARIAKLTKSEEDDESDDSSSDSSDDENNKHHHEKQKQGKRDALKMV